MLLTTPQPQESCEPGAVVWEGCTEEPGRAWASGQGGDGGCRRALLAHSWSLLISVLRLILGGNFISHTFELIEKLQK